MSKEQLLADIEREKKETNDAGFVDIQKSLVNSVFPLLEAITEWAGSELDELGDAVAEVMDDDASLEEDLIPEDLAVKVVGLINLGLVVFSKVKGDFDEETTSQMDAYKAAAPVILKEFIDFCELEDGDNDSDKVEASEETSEESTEPKSELD